MKGDVQVTIEPKGRNRHWDYLSVADGPKGPLKDWGSPT
jgi:hypothetical protein